MPEMTTAYALELLPSFKGILFDLDGTLVDHDTAGWVGAEKFALELGATPDPQRWMDIEAKWFAAFERGEVSHAGQRRERVREYLDRPQLDDDEAMALFDVYRRHYADAWRRYDDALPALERACAFARTTQATVAIFTNGAEDLQNDKLARTGLDLQGVVMIAAAELGAAKPQPESYSKASALIQCEVGECVLIGDNPVNDISGARAVGMQAIHLDRTGQATDAIDTLDLLRW